MSAVIHIGACLRNTLLPQGGNEMTNNLVGEGNRSNKVSRMQRNIGIQPASLVLLSLIMLVQYGCGTSVIPPPDWYIRPPEDPSHIYAAAKGKSRIEALASDMAMTRCMREMGLRIEAEVCSMNEVLLMDIEGEGNSALEEALVSYAKVIGKEQIAGARVAMRDLRMDGDYYLVFMLMETPAGQVKTALVSKLKADQDIYRQFRASRAFKELEEEVEKYERLKK